MGAVGFNPDRLSTTWPGMSVIENKWLPKGTAIICVDPAGLESERPSFVIMVNCAMPVEPRKGRFMSITYHIKDLAKSLWQTLCRFAYRVTKP
jgi:hypothetical protein